MSHTVKIAKNDTHVLKIMQDTDVESPRKDFDNLGTMICFHSKYNLGDNHNYSDPRDLLEDLVNQIDPDIDLNVMNMESLMEIIEKKYIIKPLYLYDHSGLSMNTTGFSCNWDSGQIGWTHVSNEKALKECDGLEVAEKCLVSEVETYDQYLRGDVFGFFFEDSEGDIIESCFGFYGLENIESELQFYIGTDHQKLIENLEWCER